MLTRTGRTVRSIRVVLTEVQPLVPSPRRRTLSSLGIRPPGPLWTFGEELLGI